MVKHSNIIRNGKWKEFNKHAVLISEGNYINGAKDGVWREYYDHTGSIMIEEVYDNGVQHGRFASFHPNGSVWSEGQFKNGRREGCFKVYNEEGRNVRTLLFVNDRQIDEVELKINHEATRKTAS